MSSSSSSSSPSWEVLILIANHLDPKTLAVASCVSKPWFASMSSDHLWKHLCTTRFPYLSHLRSAASPTLPYHRLYALGCTSVKRRRRTPQKPKLPLESLLFIITVTNSKSPPVTIVKPGSDLLLDLPGSFRFDFDVSGHEKWMGFEVSDQMKVTWNVVVGGFDGVFTMMDCKGKGRFVSGSNVWLSVELPSPGCCCAFVGGRTSGLVADLRLRMREVMGGGGGRKRMVVERVTVGVSSIVSWRYICVEDGLRYLQHFLVPSKDV